MDIVVIKNDELIYSDFDYGMVNIVKNGVLEILIIVLWGWLLKGLCFIELGDILVNMNSGV